MRLNHQTTCERDPACWEIERVFISDDPASRRWFLVRCIPTGRALTGYYIEGEDLTVVTGDTAETSGNACTCRTWQVHAECRHTAILEAVRRFLAREAEKRGVPAEERRERCRAEVEEMFR